MSKYLEACTATKRIDRCINKQKTGYIGHRLKRKMYEILRLTTEENIHGKISVGIKKFKDLTRWYGCSEVFCRRR